MERWALMESTGCALHKGNEALACPRGGGERECRQTHAFTLSKQMQSAFTPRLTPAHLQTAVKLLHWAGLCYSAEGGFVG